MVLVLSQDFVVASRAQNFSFFVFFYFLKESFEKSENNFLVILFCQRLVLFLVEKKKTNFNLLSSQFFALAGLNFFPSFCLYVVLFFQSRATRLYTPLCPSAHPSVGRLCSCPNTPVTFGITAPAHLYATRVTVYPALFLGVCTRFGQSSF